MLKQLGIYLKPPVFDDPIKTRKAIILTVFLITNILAIIPLMPISWLFVDGGQVVVLILIVEISSFSALLVVVKRGYVYQASLGACLVLWGCVTTAAYLSEGIFPLGLISHILMITIAGLLLGPKAILGFTALACSSVLILFYIDFYNLSPGIIKLELTIILWAELFVNLVLNSALLYLTINDLSQALTGSQQQAQALENQNLELTQTQQELSQTLAYLKKTQTQLVETEKMAALGNLVAGVAHEINTPVGIGVSMASMLAQETQKFTETIQTGRIKLGVLKNYIQTANDTSALILNNLQRAASLVQSFKKVAVDQSSHEQRTFTLKPYLQETLLSLHYELKQLNYQITIEGDDNLQVYSDPGDFAQIITNFVINSCRHAYQPGDTAHLIIAYHLTAENQLVFTYQDDGRGIPPGILPHIFDPFFTTARQHGGTGLGLHIIYNLVTQKHKGTIKSESEVGKGVKFIVNLPIAG